MANVMDARVKPAHDGHVDQNRSKSAVVLSGWRRLRL
jgi:hypothetical protein